MTNHANNARSSLLNVKFPRGRTTPLLLHILAHPSMFVSFVSIHHDDILISYNGLIQKEWLAHIFDFGDGALQVKCLGQYDLEDLSWSVGEEKGSNKLLF